MAFLLQPNHASAFWHTTASIIFLESVLQSQKERLEKQVDKWGKNISEISIWHHQKTFKSLYMMKTTQRVAR